MNCHDCQKRIRTPRNEYTVAEMIERQEKNARDILVRRALEKSTMLSADVTAAADPHFPDVDSTGNEARSL